MLDENSERRQYLLSSADTPAERPGRLRHHTICDQLSGLNRAMVILARGFLDGRSDETALHAARRYLESWYGYTRREYYLFTDGVWKSVNRRAWKPSDGETTFAVSLLPSRRLYLCCPAHITAKAAEDSLLAQRREDFEADLAVSDADRAQIVSVQGCLPDYLRGRILQPKYEDLIRQMKGDPAFGADLAAVQEWYDAVQADLDRLFAQDTPERLPPEQYRLAQQPLSAILSDAAAETFDSWIAPVQRAVLTMRLLSERGWSFAQSEMHTYAERKNDFNRILLDRVLSGALLAGPLQRNWLVALSSAAHDTPFTLTERVYARGKNDRRIADEKNRYRDTQIRQVLKLTAAVLLARRDAGRTSGPVLLSRAAISNWLGAAMSEKSRSKPGPLKKYYWDDPKTRQPLFPESSPNSDLTLTDLHAAWEAQWGWRVFTEAELISAVKEGSVPKDALCFTDEDTAFAPEALITARAGEIAAKEGENTHEGES